MRKDNEVKDCMEVGPSRERGAEFLAAKTLGCQRFGQLAAESTKHVRG